MFSLSTAVVAGMRECSLFADQGKQTIAVLPVAEVSSVSPLQSTRMLARLWFLISRQYVHVALP